MAATIAECIGKDSVRTKTAHRLGTESATGRASTFHTFASAHVNANGSGYIRVERAGSPAILIEFNAEPVKPNPNAEWGTTLYATYNSLAPTHTPTSGVEQPNAAS